MTVNDRFFMLIEAIGRFSWDEGDLYLFSTIISENNTFNPWRIILIVKMNNDISPVSPFSTGPGGAGFELLVTTYYLVSMLCGDAPRGLNNGGKITLVRLQQRNKNNPVDDISIQTENGTLSLSAKHSLRFTENNGYFCDSVAQCWNLYQSEKFDREKDKFGIAFGEKSNIEKVKRDLYETLTWAETSTDAQSYLSQIEKFKFKFEYYNIFKHVLTNVSGQDICDPTAWDFLRHFVIVPFDFNPQVGRDYNALESNLSRRMIDANISNVRSIIRSSHYLASEYAPTGGEISVYTLENRIPECVYLQNHSDPYKLKENLKESAKRQVQKEISSKKYIPNLFAEIPKAKDELRAFTHPVLYLRKAIEDIQKINTGPLNDMFQKVGIEPFEIQLPDNFDSVETIEKATLASHILSDELSKLKNKLNVELNPYESEFLFEIVPDAKKSIYEELKHHIYSATRSLSWSIEDIQRQLKCIASQVVIVSGKAGTGKTNFVCNFVDTTLSKRSQACLYTTGSKLDIYNTISLNKLISDSFSEEYGENFRAIIHDIEVICKEDKKPLVIIIDGINEHSDIYHFSKQLEQVIENFMSTIHVKIILTCRSEYFERRFSNLTESSFADKCVCIKNLTKDIPDLHREHMISAYFGHFRISCPFISPHVKRDFIERPLILRLFCEAYGSLETSSSKQIPSLHTIYLSEMFLKYNNKIVEQLKRKFPEGRAEIKYKQLLRSIAQYMFEKRTFSSIPYSDINSSLDSIIEMLIDEEVIFQKSFYEGTGTLTDDKAEVLKFTYDEFRDFILADYLINLFGSNRYDDFESLFKDNTVPGSPVAEGLAKYVFLAARTEENNEILRYVESCENYSEIFLSGIFSLHDDLITDNDLIYVRTLFCKKRGYAQEIFNHLIHLRHRGHYPKLNIWLILDLIATFDKNEYSRYIHSLFESYEYESICSGIEKACSFGDISSENTSGLLELLVCLFPLNGQWRSFYPAKIFFDITKKHPTVAIDIMKKYTAIQYPYLSSKIWYSLASCSFVSSQKISDETVTEMTAVAEELLQNINGSNSEGNQMIIESLEYFLDSQGRLG